MDFNINNALKLYLSDPATIPTPEADAALQDSENDPDSFTPALINSALNPIVEAIAENVDALQKSAIFDSIQLLLKYVFTVCCIYLFPLEPDANPSDNSGLLYTYQMQLLVKF